MQNKKPKFWPFAVLGLVFALALNRGYTLFSMSPPVTAEHLFMPYEYTVTNYFNPPYFLFSSKPLGFAAMAIGFFIALAIYSKMSTTKNLRLGEEAGSARFATPRELQGFQDKEPENNMLFTQNVKMGLYNKRLPFEWQLNKNVLACGLPGDGKTFTYVKPNLMQMNGSYVVTDPKGLLVHEVGTMLEEHGYQVKVFDLVTLSNSNTFNPFKYMHSELDIDRVTEAIIEGTKKSDSQGENFWVQANLLLTRALIGFLYFDSQVRGYEPNLSMIGDLLRNLQRKEEDVPAPVELMFEELEEALPGNYACRQWELFNANFQAETRNSVLAVMSAQYSVFDHQAVTDMIKTDSMDIDTWNTQKTAVFIAIPETNKAFNFLASTFFAIMFEELTHGADAIIQGRREGYSYEDLLHVQFIIDEFANIGRIPNFNEVLASVRSREMSIKIILQAINQLKALYKDDWKTILNNCATLLYLGTNDEDTMKYFSMRAGKQTIDIQNYSESRGRGGSSSTSHQRQGRDLMTPDEIARIGIDEALVFIAKQNVCRDKKTSVNLHPMKDWLADSPSDKNWYDYVRYGSDIEEFLANIEYETVVDLTAELEAEIAKNEAQASNEEVEANQAAMIPEDNAEIASESAFQETVLPIHHEKVVEDELEETEDVLPFAWDED